MSWDLHPEEMLEKASSLPISQTPEVGVFHNFMQGAAKVAMQGLAKTARAVDMVGAVGPIVQDALASNRVNTVTTAQDRYFKEHNEWFQAAVDYWTPRPNEVGVAGEVAGSLLSMLPTIMASPALAVGATQMAQAQDLVQQGVSQGKAQAVGAVQALGLGAGIWMPILGTNAVQRILIGGAGFNVAQGVATRAASKAILGDDKAAEQFRPLGGTELTLDILLGLAFGGYAHINPAMRAQGAKAWEDIGNFLKDAPPSDKAALATLREAQHINADSLPGTPVTAADLDVHVQRMRQAIDDMANDRPINVDNIVKDVQTTPPDQIITPETGNPLETIGESPSPTPDTQPKYNPDLARIEQDQAIREAIQEHARTVAAEEGIPQIPDRKTIAQTIEEQLVQAGRPPEEAKAGATLWQAFFDTTASRYGRTGQELFDRYMKGITGQAGEGPMLAQANRVIQTPEFKNWFGDSKVVDAEGKPMVVYHSSTYGDFDTFSKADQRKGMAGYGFYFSDAAGADVYSQHAATFKMDKAYDGSEKKINVMPVYLTMKNPFRVDNINDVLPPGTKQGFGVAREFNGIGAEEKSSLERRGYDGVITNEYVKVMKDGSLKVVSPDAKGAIAHPVYVVFEPTQIKSATGNRGTFDPNNPNILFQGAVPWYHSELDRQIGTAKMGSASPKDWKNYIKGLSNKGVKAEEVKWSGLEDWLDLQQGKVTKEQIQQFMKEGGVKVEETTLGEGSQPVNLNWEPQTDNLIAAKLPNGNSVTIFFDNENRASGATLQILTPEATDVGAPKDYPTIEAAQQAAMDMVNERKQTGDAKFGQWQLPGGENYRELLLTLPSGKNEAQARFNRLIELGNPEFEARDIVDREFPTFKSSHFDQPNILSHIRFNERTDAEGKRVLFIEEIQSDWAQKGKKEGFRGQGEYTVSQDATGASRATGGGDWVVTDPRGNIETGFANREAAQRWADGEAAGAGVPSAPFVGKTEAWVGLSLKRMIRYAAENGFDRVAWTNGEQQAARYDLSKHVSNIGFRKAKGGTGFDVDVVGKEGKTVWNKDGASLDEIENTLGKDIAAKVSEGAESDWKGLHGLDLKVGGEGMKAFYDRIVPNIANDVLKKLGGGRVGEVDVSMYSIKKPERPGGYWELYRGKELKGEFDTEAQAKLAQDPSAPTQQPGFDITPSMREKAMDTQALFQAGVPQTETANFKAWSNDAPLITSTAAETHDFKTGQKIVVEAYHGTQRPDRVGEKFLKKRATSGPMAFHTSSPELASGYAKGKADTSLAGENQNYEAWFKFKPKGMRSAVDLDRAWYFLSAEERARISEKLPHVTNMDAEGYTQDTYRLGSAEEYGLAGKDHWDYEIKQAKGNVLKAAKEVWLTSGSLFNSEVEFMQVLKLGDFPVKDLSFDDPHGAYPFVYKNYIQMQSPLVTNDIPQSVMDALNQAAKRDRSRPKLGGADAWDKNNRTMKDWVEVLNSPDAKHAWTSIPDKVTATLKELGFDGIVDWSGKGGGNPHPVYIPFEENQVKSAIGNKGKFSSDTNNIMRQEGERGALQFDQQGKMAIALLKSADPSTFLHESGHFFLEVTNDLASQPDAPAGMKQDMQTLYNWWNIKDADTWNNMTLDEKRPYHEQFARGFERYLRDGQAPTSALKSLFQRFRDWLKAVYESATQLNVEVSPEVRAVMDRMLANRTEAPPKDASSATPPPPRGGIGDTAGDALVLTEVQQVREDIMAAESTARARWGDAIVDALYEKYADYFEDVGQLMGMQAVMESLAEDAKPAYLMKVMGPRPKEPQSLVAAIKELGGINTSLRSDIAGPDKKGVPVGLFRKTGKNVDELALLLQEKGFLTDADIASEMDNGGVNRLIQMIQDEMGGTKHYSERDATQVQALREHDQFMESMDGKGDSASSMFTPEEWATIQREVMAEGLAPTAKNVVDADAVAIAMQIDEARVERAAITAADDFDFMAQVRDVINGYENATTPERGTPAGAAEPAQGGAATAEGRGTPTPNRDAGNQRLDPVAQQAMRMVAENPDLLIATGTDGEGNPTYQKASDYLAEAQAMAQLKRQDMGLFELAAQCLLGGGR